MAKHLVQHNQTLLFSKDGRLVETFGQGFSKKDIADLANKSVNNALEEGNVFQIAEALAAMEEFVKKIRKDERFVQLLRDELAKHNGRWITTSGAKVELCEAGVHYDYSGNGEWKELDEQIKILTEEKKAVEEKLKMVAPGKMIVDTETGEVIEAPIKSSKSTYRITLSR